MSDVRAFPGVEVTAERTDPEPMIIPLGRLPHIDLPTDQILEEHKGKLIGVALIGFGHEGDLILGTNYLDGGTVLYLLERLKQRLLEVSDEF